MNYLVGIPFVNRTDLLLQALNSIQHFWPNTVVIDNSENHALSTEQQVNSKVRVFEPPIPLTFTQSMKLLERLGRNQGCEVVMYMHVDAEAHPGTPEAFLQHVQNLQQEGRRWGVAFTYYDTLAAYNLNAMQAVGSWDTVFANYYTDVDFYRRLRLAGYEQVETHLPVTHHGGSSTYKSDPALAFQVSVTLQLYDQYYRQKWGGPPGEEQYNTPFNR